MNPKNFADLRNILAELITDEQSIRRIVDDAGIDRRNIDFRSNAKNIWHSVLTEAENLHRVEALLDVVADEYGDNQKFQAAGKAYRESINKTDGTPVGLYTAGNRQPRQVNPWRQRLPALFLGLLLIGFVGGGWYWGIFGLRANDGSIATATPTLPAPLAGTTVVATFVSTEAPTRPITSSVVTAIATNLALTDTATAAATPTITDGQTVSGRTVQPTAVFTATATVLPSTVIAIVTEIPTTTVTPTPTATFTSTTQLTATLSPLKQVRITVIGIGFAPESEINPARRKQFALTAARAKASASFAQWQEGENVEEVTIVDQGELQTDLIRIEVRAHIPGGREISQSYDNATGEAQVTVEYVVEIPE